jgi:hypothetical protein
VRIPEFPINPTASKHIRKHVDELPRWKLNENSRVIDVISAN